MGKTNRVRLRDAREIYLLVGELCELGADLSTWQHRMCERLVEIIPSRTANTGMATISEARAGKMPDSDSDAIATSGYTDRELKDLFRRYWRDEMVWTDPSFCAYMAKSGPGTARRRRELVGDRIWYRSVHYQDYYLPSGVDDCLVSSIVPSRPTGAALMHLNLSRATHDRPYSVRERRMLRLFGREITDLLGVKLVVVRDPDSEGLSPRMRQVLQCLSEGDSEKQVARRLGISPHTVHTYIKQLHRRFGVSSRGELLAASRLWTS